MSANVFISHSSKDQKVARTICTALENRGLTCWIASRNVGPGANFQESIVKAIRAAKVMVLVFTGNANNSAEIKKELALASQHGLIVIPARVEDIVPSEALAYELATRQWINLFEDWEHEIERLCTSIVSLLPPEPQATTVVPPDPDPVTARPEPAKVTPLAQSPPPQAAAATIAAAPPVMGSSEILPRKQLRILAVILIIQSLIMIAACAYEHLGSTIFAFYFAATFNTFKSYLLLPTNFAAIVLGIAFILRIPRLHLLGLPLGAVGTAVHWFLLYVILDEMWTIGLSEFWTSGAVLGVMTVTFILGNAFVIMIIVGAFMYPAVLALSLQHYRANSIPLATNPAV